MYIQEDYAGALQLAIAAPFSSAGYAKKKKKGGR